MIKPWKKKTPRKQEQQGHCIRLNFTARTASQQAPREAHDHDLLQPEPRGLAPIRMQKATRHFHWLENSPLHFDWLSPIVSDRVRVLKTNFRHDLLANPRGKRGGDETARLF